MRRECRGMKLSEFLEGLTILKPHYKGGDGFHLGAEHDVFYAYATDTPLTTSRSGANGGARMVSGRGDS